MNFDILPLLQKYISPEEKYILACSTGPDSMFLLYKILETPYRKNVVVAYFNHKIRPEADEEEVFIKDIGEKERILVETKALDIPFLRKNNPSQSLEELSREKRYAFFEELRKKYHGKYILTGHHLDDRIETFFFNLSRGSKLTGLINMTELSGNILRPLLHLQKQDIEEYLKENKLPYRQDTTNTDTAIARNKLRMEIVPEFEELNKNYKGNIEHLLAYFEELKNYIDNEVQTFL